MGLCFLIGQLLLEGNSSKKARLLVEWHEEISSSQTKTAFQIHSKRQKISRSCSQRGTTFQHLLTMAYLIWTSG
jgi:hypothetical protein